MTTTDVADHGPISYMKVPAGWVPAQSEDGGAQNSRLIKQFHPPETSAVRLCVYSQVKPLSQQSAINFKAVLTPAPHALSPAEINMLRDVLKDRSDEELFKMVSCRSEDFHGKRVIVLKGRYLESDEGLLTIIVPMDVSGHFVQEVYFRGPLDLYSQHEKTAKASMKTIIWK